MEYLLLFFESSERLFKATELSDYSDYKKITTINLRNLYSIFVIKRFLQRLNFFRNLFKDELDASFRYEY
jgi:hypothetical protein